MLAQTIESEKLKSYLLKDGRDHFSVTAHEGGEDLGRLGENRNPVVAVDGEKSLRVVGEALVEVLLCRFLQPQSRNDTTAIIG